MIILSYGSIIPQRDQVVQRNQGETGSRSPLLSLGFKSRVSILVYVLRFVCPLSDIEQQIKETEKQLNDMLDELTGNEFDMKGIHELKKLLGGE